MFDFSKLGKSILRKGIQFVAMIEFRKRATTVSVDPNTLFNFLLRCEYSPPFDKLSRAKTEDDFKELKKNNNGRKQRHHKMRSWSPAYHV